MHAQIYISLQRSLERGDAVAALCTALGVNVGDTIRSSDVVGPELRDVLVHSCTQPGLLLFCFQTTPREIQVIVECSYGDKMQTDILTGCGTAYSALRHALKPWRPHLHRAEIVDRNSGRQLLRGQDSVVNYLKRPALSSAIAVAVVAAVLAVSGLLEWKPILSALGAAVVQVAALGVQWSRRRLVWSAVE